MKKIFTILIILFSVIVSIEIFLRQYYGFCNTVLMNEDKDFEYIPQPNQRVFRFRNYINYNQYSMRSDEIDTNAIIILGFGDSVLNGGVLTTQSDLATTILSEQLSRLYHKKVQFLNISAGSWGPDNCYQYLKRYKNFNSKHIFLVVSSHDAYDNMTFDRVVGSDENYPSKQYISAIAELFNRYIIPRVYPNYYQKQNLEKQWGINKKEINSKFNIGFEQILAYARSNNISLTIYLHAEEGELKTGSYNQQGEEIIKFAKENKVNIIQDLHHGLKQSYFRDNIHYNKYGQKLMASNIFKFIVAQNNSYHSNQF